GDVFALVQIADGGRSTRVPWTVLQADAAPGEDGSCPCRLLPSRKQSLTGSGGSFRCLKLGTVKEPLRLRVVKGGVAKVQAPPDSLVVQVRRNSFTDVTKADGTTDAEGFFVTDKKDDLYDGLALVTVLQGKQPRALAAVPLVDQRTVVLPVRLGA